MSTITSIGTYRPRWGSEKGRTAGVDEDAVTLAVAAGLAALTDIDPGSVTRVVLVSRDLPLLDGGNSAALLAGLGVSAHTPVSEVVGGAPVVLDTVATAAPGTLVIGSETAPYASASAAFCGATGVELHPVDSVTRSMPVTTRNAQGKSTDYADPRLLRERGVAESLARLDQSGELVAVAGVAGREGPAKRPEPFPTGASSILTMLAALVEGGHTGRVGAVEQAAASVAELGPGSATVTRDERPAAPMPKGTFAPGNDLPISLSAYDRAFDAKLRLEAARCTNCGTLSYPHRYRCIECGSEQPTEVVPLPREAEIYTLATVRVPVPGLISPYTLTLVELGDTGVRLLVKLTGAEPGSVRIGDRGTLVFRLVAVRSGVPDYGYGFLPDEPSAQSADTSGTTDGEVAA
jgi:uncharacterized OB-fold protein